MSKEVSKKEETNLAQFANFSVAPEMDTIASMIKLPRLSIMQKTSKPVEDDKAKIGELYENLGQTVVCGKDKPFKFVPLKIQPVITTYEEVDGRPKYKSHVAMTASNQKYNWDAGERGEIHLYMLAANELDNPTALPYLFTVKGASMKTFGKAIYTYSQLIKAAKQHPFMYYFNMTNKKEEKDGNSYQVAYVDKPVEKVDPKYFGVIDMWLTTLNSMNNVEVVGEEESDESKTSSKSVQF